MQFLSFKVAPNNLKRARFKKQQKWSTSVVSEHTSLKMRGFTILKKITSPHLLLSESSTVGVPYWKVNYTVYSRVQSTVKAQK